MMRRTFDSQPERKCFCKSLIGLIAIALTVSSCSKIDKTSESSADKAQAADSTIKTSPNSGKKSDMVMIFDGTDNKSAEPDTASLEKLFKSTIYPAARKYWESDEANLEFEVSPDSEPTIQDMAEGSFTDSGKKQKAVLYQLSESGHGFCTNGIVVLEKDAVVAHFVYQGGADYSLKSVPDINKNGKNELAIEGGSTNQGETESSINIVELSSDGVKKFGFTTTYFDNDGSLEEKKVKEGYQIFARPSNNPADQAEFYAKKVDMTATDKASGTAKPELIKLEKSEIEFYLVK